MRISRDSAFCVKLVFDAEPFHAIAQRPERYAEHFCGSRSVVMRLLERIENRLALYRVQTFLKRQTARRRNGGLLGFGCAARGELQVFGVDLIPTSQRECAFENVLELANVSREIVGEKGRLSLFGEFRRLSPGALALKERCSKLRNVFTHLAQAWHSQFDNVQSVIQVLSESAAFNFLADVTLRSADNPYVHGLFSGRANFSHLLFLNRAQQLDLHLQWQIGDFV